MLRQPGVLSKGIKLAHYTQSRTSLSSSQLYRSYDLSPHNLRIHNDTKVICNELTGKNSPHVTHDPSKIEPGSSKLSVNSNSGTDLRTSKTMKTSTRFWDNKSLLCVREHDDNHINSSKASEEEALDFNPAVDAMNAFRIATLIVFGVTVLTIGGLSKRWELDGWDDWRIFIQAGHLGKVLIPKNWYQSASQAIPNRLRPDPTSLSEQELMDEQELIDSWHWKKRVDREWEVERNRREVERSEWEARRRTLGKKIW